MTATAQRPSATVTIAPEITDAINTACARIAPAWPLDRLIAVNPYWGFVHRPITDAAAEFGALSGSRLTMSRQWMRARQAQGAFSDAQLHRAAVMLAGASAAPQALGAARAALTSTDPDVPMCQLMPELVDDTREVSHHALWHDFVVQNVSWACGSYYADGQASWTADRSAGLYALWRELASHDPGPRLLMGLKGFADEVKTLPENPHALIAEAVGLLAVTPTQLPTYFTALLMDVPGWAAACAFARWEARLGGSDDNQIEGLLAVRLAWEVLLYRLSGAPDLASRWQQSRRSWEQLPETIRAQQLGDWTVQRALELGYQERLAAALATAPALTAGAAAGIATGAAAGTAAGTATGAAAGAAAAGAPQAPPTSPSAQAVFCIDVRSEVIRRALESAAPDIHTLGFAGFFGLPIAYAPAEGDARPQLPGLLSPAVQVRDEGVGANAHAERVRQRSGFGSQWKKFLTTAGSGFSAVEATGMGYAFSLVRDGLATRDAELDPLRGDLATGGGLVVPRFPTRDSDPAALDTEARVATAAAVLRGMSLTHDFAPIVAFIGHGATVTNNPQAAGLACGACGGQSGEVNARVLAALLNEPGVREGLVAQGITVPASTHFVPGLHNTVTDEITLFDLHEAPTSHRDKLQAFSKALADGGAGARQERAAALGLAAEAKNGSALLTAMRRRAADWSEVRPEWGLAGNAAFIIAPRFRTRGVKLGGRTFLHEYRWEEDSGFGVLTVILTAPMVVTNWINMQYNASTADPERFGSGDKVLHNVAGGNMGVYEGAGGDLRIGLALQSVHNGDEWMHEPLRLSVLVEAPAVAIDDIIAKHAVVEQLALNGWLHLIRIDSDTGALFQRTREGWVPLADGNTV